MYTLQEWAKTSEYYSILTGIKLDGETLLHLAASDNEIELVKILIEFNVDVNVKRGDGWTPLHNACSEGNEEIVELLLTNGANTMIENELKRTPWYYASENPLIKHAITCVRKAELKQTEWFTQNVVMQFQKHFYTNLNIKKICDPNTFSFKLIPKRFCKTLMKSIKNDSPLWSLNYGENVTDENSLQFLKLLTDPEYGPLSNFFRKYFPSKKNLYLDSATILAIRDSEEQNVVCSGHTDDSDISINICIYSQNLQGSEVVFNVHDKISKLKHTYPYKHRIGYCVIHPGVVNHHVTPLISGSRVNLLLWLKNNNSNNNLQQKNDNHQNSDNLSIYQQENSFFVNLPFELHVNICKSLTARDLLALGFTCKTLYNILGSDWLWKPLFLERFPLLSNKSPLGSYRSFYVSQFTGMPERLELQKTENLFPPQGMAVNYLIVGYPRGIYINFFNLLI